MTRVLSFLYGIIAYAVFLVAFLYAIIFVGNIASLGSITFPKVIDSGTTGSFMQSLLINACLLSVFALQHSVMARPAFKKWWTTIVSPAIERSTYVLLSSLALLLLYWKWQPMTDVVWKADGVVANILTVLYYLGWLIVFFSTFMINHFDLFGLKQVYNNMKGIQPGPGQFRVNWFYKIVRHPIMLGFIIAFWSAPVMTVGHLVFTATSTLYILIAVKFLEERDLMKAHPVEYAAYKKNVPMLFPFLKSKK